MVKIATASLRFRFLYLPGPQNLQRSEAPGPQNFICQDAEIRGDLTVGGKIQLPGADYCELFPLADPGQKLVPRQVVGVQKNGKLSLDTSDPIMVGVVSEPPSIRANSNAPGKSAPVAFIGRVMVNISGNASPGDYLAPSGMYDGRAIKCDPTAGTVIGTMIGVVSTNNTVEVLLRNHSAGNFQSWMPHLSAEQWQQAATLGKMAISMLVLVLAALMHSFSCPHGGVPDGSTHNRWLTQSCIAAPGYNGYSPTFVPCRQGSYKPLAGPGECLWCPKGSTTHSQGSVNEMHCVADKGFQQSSGRFTPCPVHTYSVVIGQQSCTACAPNTGTQMIGADTRLRCVPKPGYFQTSESENTFFFKDSATQRVQPCPPGTYKTEYGNGVCLDCAAGETSSEGSSYCTCRSAVTCLIASSLQEILQPVVAAFEIIYSTIKTILEVIYGLLQAGPITPDNTDFEFNDSSNQSNRCPWDNVAAFASSIKSTREYHDFHTCFFCKSAKKQARAILRKYHPDKFRNRYPRCDADMSLWFVQELHAEISKKCE